MTIKFYNTNDSLADEGPFEAESKEALADEIMPELKAWAEKHYYTDRQHLANADEDEMEMPAAEWITGDIARMRAEFIDGLEAQWHGEPRIIFDNGGGITLQLKDFAHHYGDVEQCADDLANWVEDDDTSDWDGNEEEAVFEPTNDQISNGGYRVETVEDFMSLPLCEVRDMSWGNMCDLYVELTKRVIG